MRALESISYLIFPSMICEFQNHVRCYRHKEQRWSGGLHRGSRAQCDCRLLEPTRIVSEGKERREMSIHVTSL